MRSTSVVFCVEMGVHAGIVGLDLGIERGCQETLEIVVWGGLARLVNTVPVSYAIRPSEPVTLSPPAASGMASSYRLICRYNVGSEGRKQKSLPTKISDLTENRITV